MLRKSFPYVLLFFLSILLFLRPIDSDGDFFQHVNIGKFVLFNLALPHYDNLTFTANGHEYIGYAWASGVIFYFLYSNFGFMAINILVLAIGLLTTFLLYSLLKILVKSDKTALVATLVTVPIVASRWPTRPEIFIYPIFIGYFLLDLLWQKKPWLLIFFPLLTLLLVNLYGSSFPAAGIVLILLAIKNLKNKNLLFFLTIFSCFPLALLNGYGFKSLLFITLIPKMTTLWGDWGGIIDLIKGPNFYGFSGGIIYAYIFYFIFFLILIIFGRKILSKNLFYFVLSLSLIIPFIAIRQRALVVILASPMLAILLAEKKHFFYPSIILGGILIMLILTVGGPKFGGNEEVFPPKMISFIKEKNLSGRVFNTQQIGSFLEYNLSSQTKTFSDTRDDLFIGTNVLESISPFLSHGVSLNYILRKYNVNIVILSITDGFSINDLEHDPHWLQIYRGERYHVFTRK